MFFFEGRNVELDELSAGFKIAEVYVISDIQAEGKLVLTDNGLIDIVTTFVDTIGVNGKVIGQKENVTEAPASYEGSLIKKSGKYKSVVSKIIDEPLFDSGEMWSGTGVVDGTMITISNIEEAQAIQLQLAILEAKVKIRSYASNLKRQFSENADMEDLASWPELISISKQVIDGTADPDDIEILQIECDKRDDGITVNMLAESVLTKRKTHMKTLGAIKGLTANALRRISTAQSIEAIKIQMDELKTEAAFEITELTKYT